MTRVLPAVAVGGLLALIGLVAVLAIQPRGEPSAAERADAVARELRCPDCQGLSVADSPTSSAQEIRRQIEELVADGASAEEVRAHFAARYGEWILLAPSSPVAWLLPFAVVLLGVGALVTWFMARRRHPAPLEVGSVSPEERRALHEEAEALDA